MTPRNAAAVLAVILGVAAPATAAYAHGPYQRPAAAWTSGSWGGEPRGAHDGANFARCPMSSAAEGNANQQNFPVKQYGQVAGGYRC